MDYEWMLIELARLDTELQRQAFERAKRREYELNGAKDFNNYQKSKVNEPLT